MPRRKNRSEKRRKQTGKPGLPLGKRPGYLVRRLHQIHLALFLEECKTSQLTPVQYGLMTALCEHGELDQVSLAEEVGLERTTAAEVLTRLERRKLVSRKANPRDLRAKLVRITPRGRALTSATFGSMQRAQERLTAPLDSKERDVFIAMLVRLIDGRGALRMD
jgi:DNA-binding MarR family transcriptional regulator